MWTFGGVMLCGLFHKWDKWKPYIWEGVTNPTENGDTWCLSIEPLPNAPGWVKLTEHRERRSCARCGETQDRQIDIH